MKPAILLLALSVAAISSCSTAYKTGQTPDDVYYSPVRPQDEYVRNNDNDDQKYYSDDYYDNRFLRMKVHNHLEWSELDDWYYYGNRYNYTYYTYNTLNNPWSPYSYWNYYYNPYYTSYAIVNPKYSVTYFKPRVSNLNTFNSRMLTNSNYTTSKSFTGTSNTNYKVPNYSTNNNNSPGGFLRNLFSGSNSSNSSSSGSKSSGSSGSSSSGGGGGGGSAPVRRF